MKRGIKICLALAGTLFVLGLTLNLVGAAMGGRRESNQYFEERLENFSWDKTWGPILVNSDGVYIGGKNGIHVDSGGVDIGGANGIHVGHSSGDSHSGRKQLVQSGALTGVTGLDVDIDCGDVWLQEGEELSVCLEWNLDNYTMSYQVEDGVLKVEDETWGSGHLGTLNIDCSAIITVPAGTDLREVKLSTNMGDVEVDAAITAREATLSTDMGDVTCCGLQADQLDAESDMGDVAISLPKGRENYTWELETDLGELTVDGEIRNSGMGKLTDRGGSGKNTVEASSSMGNVEISFS